MNSRVSNPESYIFSAIIHIGKDNFTSNDVAIILVERFSFPKTYLKAKAFAYNQIQCLVKKGLLNKVRKSGVYQYLYSATSEFNIAMENVQLIEATQKSFRHFSSANSHEYNNVNIQIRTLLKNTAVNWKKYQEQKKFMKN